MSSAGAAPAHPAAHQGGQRLLQLSELHGVCDLPVQGSVILDMGLDPREAWASRWARCCAARVVGGALGPRMTSFCSPSVPDPPSPLRLWSPLPIKHTVWDPHMPPARLLLGVGEGAVRGRANIYGALTVGLQVATVPTSHSWGHWGWGIPVGPRALSAGFKGSATGGVAPLLYQEPGWYLPFSPSFFSLIIK